MRDEKPTWFWVLTASFILAWSVAGTLSIIFILNGSVYLGEAVIIATTIILVIVYFVTDWMIERK
jgi:ACR3 family arsenite efflux pump ArsB